MNGLNSLAGISESQLAEIDALCTSFVEALRRGERPQIEDILSEVQGELQSCLAAELTREEIAYRRDQGEKVAIDEYLRRLPLLAPHAGSLLDADSEVVLPAQGNGSGSLDLLTGTSIRNLSKLLSVTIEPLPLKFGRFQIEQELGRGGMGVVYLAYDEQLDRRIALKAPTFTASNFAELGERFLRESRAMAKVRHANLCPVYEAGEIDGRQYLAMAYIEGETLRQKLQSGQPWQPRDAAILVRKLADGIQAAHDAGIVHRDLKPSNVLLDLRVEPVITDFGLARRDTTGEVDLTHTGVLVGSPAYMSPEQVEGGADQVGSATDIHALGVILYELLTGRKPFEGSFASVVGQIVHKEPIPANRLNPAVSEELTAICRRALAKRIEDRFASAAEMAAALDHAIHNHRPQAPLPAKTIRRAAMIAAGTLLIAGLPLLLLRLRDKAPPGPQVTNSARLTNVVPAAQHSQLPWHVTDSGQRLDQGATVDCALGDLDGDGDLDAFSAVQQQACRVWLNNGQGVFRDSGQLLGGTTRHYSVALADLDGDGDLDAFVADTEYEHSSVWLNDGRANFVRTEQVFPPGLLDEVTIADIDGDGDRDVVLSHWLGQIEVLHNDGAARFQSTDKFPHPASTGVALADMDGDGAIDIVASRLGGRANIWWNNGQGEFLDGNWNDGPLDGLSLAVADLDGDKRPDLYFTSLTGDVVVFNAGGRNFNPPSTYVGEASSETVRLADLDGDGDVDAITVPGFRFGTYRRIWINDGLGHFTPGPRLTNIRSANVSIGDLNGDGAPDFIFSNHGDAPDDVWINSGSAKTAASFR